MRWMVRLGQRRRGGELGLEGIVQNPPCMSAPQGCCLVGSPSAVLVVRGNDGWLAFRLRTAGHGEGREKREERREREREIYVKRKIEGKRVSRVKGVKSVYMHVELYLYRERRKDICMFVGREKKRRYMFSGRT